jgi:predicted membrane channel-forming protein YqfA (hemolysin III family)
LEQTRDSVLRYGEVVGCELLNFFVLQNVERPVGIVTRLIGVLAILVAALVGLLALGGSMSNDRTTQRLVPVLYGVSFLLMMLGMRAIKQRRDSTE